MIFEPYSKILQKVATMLQNKSKNVSIYMRFGGFPTHISYVWFCDCFDCVLQSAVECVGFVSTKIF